MPVLRLQQSCSPRRHRRGALRARLRARDRSDRGARARPRRLHHLLRRRHAVADAAVDRRCAARRRSPSTGPLLPASRSRSKPTRPASKPSASAAIAPPASIASRSACSRSTIASLKELGRLHTGAEALDAVAVARSIFRALFVRSDLCAARADAASWARRAQAARSRKRPSISRSINSPSSRTRRFLRCIAPASSRSPTTTPARALYDTTQEICAAARPAGLRDFQSRAAGRGVPAQSRLLARRRICRHRPRRAWPAQYRRRALRHRDREAAGKLADARRGDRPRAYRRRAADAEEQRRRISC